MGPFRCVPQNRYFAESGVPFRSVPQNSRHHENDDFAFHFKLSILMDTCHGLQFLHSQNIIHRDLSSNNILLTKHLVAKISDLGMAKIIPPDLQKHTQAPGTVVFMPPEALSVNPQYGKPIDIFSVGCVCVHVISR